MQRLEEAFSDFEDFDDQSGTGSVSARRYQSYLRLRG